LIAHGRGECFDYLIGEKTQPFAFKAEKAAVALLLLSNHPVISVNGNCAALCPTEIVKLAYLTGSKVEVNLFHRTFERERIIEKILRKQGLDEVLGVGENASGIIPTVCSLRCRVDPRGLLVADTVLLSIEDGDRTMAYRKAGKNVIAIDLNPFSRTAIWASITIVDNVVRAFPNMIKLAKNLKKENKETLKKILETYNNDKILKEAVKFINQRLVRLGHEKVFGFSLTEEVLQLAKLNPVRLKS